MNRVYSRGKGLWGLPPLQWLVEIFGFAWFMAPYVVVVVSPL